MTKSAQLAGAVLFWVAVAGLIAFLAHRSTRSFAAYLDAQGFAKQPSCPARVMARDHELRGVACWRGPLSRQITGEVLAGYIPSLARRGYRYFLGVVVAPGPAIDDAWFHRWAAQDTSRLADGRYVVLWNLVDSRPNAARVLAEVRASLPP